MIRKGTVILIGKPCRHGHTPGRYASCDRCVECARLRSEQNRDRRQQTLEHWKRKNRKRVLASNKVWAGNNRQKVNANARRWKRNNRDKASALNASRRARKAQVTPVWLTSIQKADILSFYTKASEEGLQVDHIVPLKGEYVCGLHVPWNLQLLTAQENSKKGNSMTG